MQKKIGLTTTIPVEVIFAANHSPVDLNNLFISSRSPQDLIRRAEADGLPRNTCSWIKGIYGVLSQSPEICDVAVVMRGDCSNAVALAEVLRHKNYNIIPFCFPVKRDGGQLRAELSQFMQSFKVNPEQVNAQKIKLDRIRAKLNLLDELTWRENKVTGFENHFYLVSASDFGSNPDNFEKQVITFLREAANREPFSEKIRLGYVGVPPMVSDLYTYLEALNARVVYNETQSQFAMLRPSDDIVEQYLSYTYPYDIFGRIDEIKSEIEKRKLRGIIHYVQSFCHHQIIDTILQKEISVPILTLECDQPGPLALREKLRLEAFVNMLNP